MGWEYGKLSSFKTSWCWCSCCLSYYPSTATVENYAMFHANGYIDGEVIMVESEHAAMSACVGAGVLVEGLQLQLHLKV